MYATIISYSTHICKIVVKMLLHHTTINMLIIVWYKYKIRWENDGEYPGHQGNYNIRNVKNMRQEMANHGLL